jgi:hypothetical protein
MTFTGRIVTMMLSTRIVERVQQADLFGQMRQLYARCSSADRSRRNSLRPQHRIGDPMMTGGSSVVPAVRPPPVCPASAAGCRARVPA